LALIQSLFGRLSQGKIYKTLRIWPIGIWYRGRFFSEEWRVFGNFVTASTAVPGVEIELVNKM
jgi:hypothetical protein